MTVLREYEYAEGVLEIGVGGNTRIDRVVNNTLANSSVASGFYSFYDGKLIIDERIASLFTLTYSVLRLPINTVTSLPSVTEDSARLICPNRSRTARRLYAGAISV